MKNAYVFAGLLTVLAVTMPGLPGCSRDVPNTAESPTSEAELAEPVAAEEPKVTIAALPLAENPVEPEWQRLYLPLVLWDHYESLVTTIVLAMNGVRIDVPLQEWMTENPVQSPHATAAALVTALRDGRKEDFLALVQPPEGVAVFPDIGGFWDALRKQYGGYAQHTFQLRFRLGGVEGFTVLFEEPAEAVQEVRQVWTLPLMLDETAEKWELVPDVMTDGRWGAVSAVVHEEFKNPDVKVPALTAEEAQREHVIELPRLWGDRENQHPIAVYFNGGVPGPARPDLAALAEEMGEIWDLFRAVLADFSSEDPAFRSFLERLSQGSADFMVEFLETRENEVIHFWQSNRPEAEDVRFIIDAGPLYIFFYPTMQDGPKDVMEFLRGKRVDGRLMLTNIGNDDYFSGMLLAPAFNARFMGLIRGLEQEQEVAALEAAKAAQAATQAEEAAPDEAEAPANGG